MKVVLTRLNEGSVLEINICLLMDIYNYSSTKYCCPKGNWEAYLYKIKKYEKIMNIIKINYIINISKMINLMSIYEIISIRSIFRIYRILNILEILYRSRRSGDPHLLNSFGLID